MSLFIHFRLNKLLKLVLKLGMFMYLYLFTGILLICSIVPEQQFQQVTSYTRSAVLLGLFFGAVLAQMLVSFVQIDYFYLNVIALINICIGFCISLFLPLPKKTLFFFPKINEDCTLKLGNDNEKLQKLVNQESQINYKV